jgi:diguanylate cyclase (GGDEF)-like protein
MPTLFPVAILQARQRMLLGLFCCMLALSVLLPLQAAAEAPRLLLNDQNPSVDAWPAVSVLSDADKKFDIGHVLAAKAQFAAPTSAYATLGMRKDAVWVRVPLHVQAQADGHWILDVDYTVLNSIDVYVTEKGRVLQQAALGNMRNYEQRPISSRTHSIALKLAPGADYDIYLRIENNGAMMLPISISKPAVFHARALDEQMLQGLLTGLGICLLIYSLAQWISLKEHLFIKYALLITGSLMFSLLHFGIGLQYVWRDNFWMEMHAGGLSASIAACGSFLFIEQALAGPSTTRRFSVLMKAGAAIMAVSALAYSMGWIDVHVITAIVSTVGLAPALMGMPGAFSRARNGDSVGIYFLIAWAVYFVTTAVMIGVIKGSVPVNFWTMHSFQFGATIDMLMFMRVLGLRTVAIQTAARRVAQERDALHSLAYSDPLTGLPNRRGLSAAVMAALPQCTPERILAVYMLDLDGFKLVNDQYGHDVGDELLVVVATRLQANLRSTDIVARLGGDEFVVMSTGLHNAQQAQDLGEKLLHAFSEPFTLSERTCSVGLTIGYALAPLDAHDTISLMKRADAAMYAGKQGGKNCVRRGEASVGLT